MNVYCNLLFLVAVTFFSSYNGEARTAPELSFRNADPFTINLGIKKSVTLDLRKIIPENIPSKEKLLQIRQIYVGILISKLKCVEVLSANPIPYWRKDGLYNHVPINYDITEDQFRTLLDGNPLVVVKFNPKVEGEARKFNDYDICGENLPSFAGNAKNENARILAKENLKKSAITPKGSPDERCEDSYIPFSNNPGTDIQHFRDIQTHPVLKRFGLSSFSSVNEVPEGVKFIAPNPSRPLMGFGSHPALKALLIEEPVCDISLLREQLQTAIELEWSTLPLYLTAYYSIMYGENDDIRSTIDDISIQEMLHFAQAANLLIAAGGVPDISASKAPSYPRTGLPGGVLEGLEIPLTKLTIDQTYNTFMGVEIPNNSSAVNPPLINELFTIGAFYADVLNCIEYLGDSAFASPSGDQVEYNFGSHGTLYTVTNVETARTAIDQIVAQGEGESPLNPDQIGAEGYAHFYSYEEVVCGNKLVKKDETYYAYEGEEIPFNSQGVYNMIDNPSKDNIASGTDCYTVAKAFNDAYGTLIEKLDHAFKVVSSSTINDAVGEMYTLAGKARDVFDVPYTEGSSYTCGLVWNMDF